MIREEAKLALHNLKSWMAPESVSTPIVMLPSTCYIKREPFGTCLIISPWNYPRACWGATTCRSVSHPHCTFSINSVAALEPAHRVRSCR